MSEMMDECCDEENDGATPFPSTEYPSEDNDGGVTEKFAEPDLQPEMITDSVTLQHDENGAIQTYSEEDETDKFEGVVVEDIAAAATDDCEGITATDDVVDYESKTNNALDPINDAAPNEEGADSNEDAEGGFDENAAAAFVNEEILEDGVEDALIIETHQLAEEEFENFGEEDEPTVEANASEVEEVIPNVTQDSVTEGDVQNQQNLDPLPDCRNKRSYVCGFCNMKTNNPREYLYHLKDTHGENIRIFECSRCIYASKTQQKLVRHNHMVHKISLITKVTDQRKKPKEKIFKPSHNKKVKPFPISRSPRESKSPRRFEEYEYMDDSELDYDESSPPPKISAAAKTLHRCDQCNFTTYSTKVLGKHENKYHLKRRFFKCTRCNYATQVKARYTKHMKYHQLPIIKCDWCDFRTPYRWNLDRHTKNHTEDVGEHRCHLCNFTAPIKQSLTVHVANHHLTPEQIKQRESKRTIGICDPEDCIADEEMELLRMERDEDPDALELPDSSVMSSNQSFTVSNIDMGNQDDLDASFNGSEEHLGLDEPKRKKPKIKITLKKMKTPKDTFFQELNERHNFDEDFIHPDDVVQRHGNVYIKTEKCSLCPFKAPFQHEIQRHKKKVHGIHALKNFETAKKVKKTKSLDKFETSESSSDSASENLKRRYSLNSNSNDIHCDMNEEKSDDIPDDIVDPLSHKEEPTDPGNSKCEESSSKEPPQTKKKSSFFDKLQEKLSSSNVQNLVCQFCGHESKCLSESVRHQKLHLSAKNVYATPSLSTRCQFCRHRCKTTDDLMNHLKSCPEARKNQISDNMNVDANEEIQNDKRTPKNKDNEDVDEDHNSSEFDSKHPMENKVFVWNNISNFEDDSGNSPNDADEVSPADGSRTPSESAFSIHDSDHLDEFNNEVEETPHHHHKIIKKRVYRCPQCHFWSATASRFHVHIVGHYNTKPYGCSECGYRSNWRWDITKHIKLKVAKDKNHRQAGVCLADETGEKNYEKYDKYLVEVRVDQMHASRAESGLSSRRGRPKRNPENDSNETDSAKSSPCPTPLTISSVPTSTTTPSTGPSTSKIPAPPKLMRAPNRQFTSSPGPNPFGPINPAAQMMVEMGNANPSEGDAAKKKFSMKPPPLVAMGTLAQQQQQQQTPSLSSAKEDEASQAGAGSAADGANPAGSNYQIITPQGALTTSLETLQLLAAGSTNLAKLKRQQKETGEGKNPELDAAVANQMRLLLWLNCLAREAEQKENEVGGTTSDPPISSIMQLVLDHEGNPEWKCLSCDFRDNEQETVVQHVRLAHSKKGPVSLLHAVHRCSVCGFAAGTKRHVQVHLENAHNGQGGIISRSEGQNIDPESGNDESNRSFDCRLCPFTCKKRGELKTHLSHHTPRVDYVFKCMFCPYYVATKNDLFNHLNVHGMDLPAASKEASSSGTTATTTTSTTTSISTAVNSTQIDDANARHFVCDLCPFETRSRAKLMHHRQFHRPRGLAFSCPHCSYNVTRRHLLAQHLRIHGVSPTEGLEVAENSNTKHGLSKLFPEDATPFSRSKSPSPSLTITPINAGKAAADGDSAPPKIDPDCLPTLSDELTKNLHDIPLVWVSRDGRFFKMFKCRHCPHVNLRKTNIQEHEKMHRSDGLAPGTGHACQFCSYICINAGVMSAHLKVHNGSIGKCHAIVDQALPNEEQLHMLAGSAMRKAQAERAVKHGDEKLLYFCQNCPARFFFEKEVQIHSRSHISNAKFTQHCPKCNFGAREESQILAHAKVHTPEYQERTRTLVSMHPPAPSFPPVRGLSVPAESAKSTFGVPLSDNENNVSGKSAPVNGFSRPWLTSPPPSVGGTPGSGNLPQAPPTSRFKCDQCPSTFGKLITLQYHQSLHSADNPFRCNRCTYAAKTQDGLQQHLVLHEQADLEKSSTGSFLSASSSPIPSPAPITASKKSLEETLGSLTGAKMKKGLMGPFPESLDHPPIKLKFIGLKGASASGSSKKQFKYYIEEQVPLSGVELLKRKNQIEREMPKDLFKDKKIDICGVASIKTSRPAKQDDRTGNPKLHYPLHIDKSSGRSREKRYKCVKCPSAFEKLDQYNVHLNLHGSSYKYKCRICDYTVKFYANFMMHIKRHKYHEKMDAQKKGLPLPLEDQLKYEPVIGEKVPVEEISEREEILGDKENQLDLDAYPDMTTAEKQQLILQHKKADAFKPKEDDKDKKVFYCQYCPYANMRRDAVDSHSLRHQANMGRGLYQCNFCDYTASQPNFIREHTRVHFRPFKYVQPEGFMRHDKLEIWSIKSGESIEDDDTPKKSLVFVHDEGSSTPQLKSEGDALKPEPCSDVKPPEESCPLNLNKEEEPIDSQEENGILIDFRSGDVVDAPTNFIIPLRPTKSKITTSLVNGGSGTTLSSSSSGKHKSSKYLRARKKTKLETPEIIPQLPRNEESKSDGEENYNCGTGVVNACPSDALSNPEDACNSLGSPLPSNTVNGDIANENSNDTVDMKSADDYQTMETTSLKENFNSITAVSN